MKSDDVNDIFKDFEHKVTGKEDSSEKPEKLSEEEHLKRRYREAEDALKNRYNEEKEALKEEKSKDAIKHGKPSSGPVNIERFAFIGVILVLVVFIGIDFSFYHGNQTDVEQQTITASVVDSEDEVVEENITEEVVEETAEEEEIEEEVILSGKITLTMDKVFTEVVDEDKGYITKVDFTIDNGKDKVLTPIVNVFAYDSEMHESWETRSRGEYTYAVGIKPGDKHTGTVSLSPKTFINLDIGKIVRIELNSTEESFIAAKSKTVTIS